MSLKTEQLLGGLAADLKAQYDAATGQYYVMRNGIAVVVPYYETIISGWAAAAQITVTHGLGVFPKLVMFEIVALAAIGELAIDEVEEIQQGYNNYGGAPQYGVIAKKKTTTDLRLRLGSGGLVVGVAGGKATAVTNAQANLKVKVWGF